MRNLLLALPIALVALLAASCGGNDRFAKLVNDSTQPTPPAPNGMHVAPMIPTGTATIAEIGDSRPAQVPDSLPGLYSISDENDAIAVSNYGDNNPLLGYRFRPSAFRHIDFTSLGKPAGPIAVNIGGTPGESTITVTGGAGGSGTRTYQLRATPDGFLVAALGPNDVPVVLDSTPNTRGGCVETVLVGEEITINTQGAVEYIVSTSTAYKPPGTCSREFVRSQSAIETGGLGPFWQLAGSVGAIDVTRLSYLKSIGMSFYYSLTK